MKKLVVFGLLLLSKNIYCNTLEFHYNAFGSTYTYFDKENTVRNQLFYSVPFLYKFNKNLIDIIKIHPEVHKKIKMARSIDVLNDVFIGIGFGSMVGLLGLPISLIIHKYQYNDFSNYNWVNPLNIITYVFSPLVIISLVTGFILEFYTYPKLVKKAFELYNKINNEKLSIITEINRYQINLGFSYRLK